ncbi:hypothetical protein EV360DRAFT_96894 [Lentinula raphanica]|nr:hypothetical protein EV360DRAFT_96894 [Lentinula raphanica]
MTAHNGYKIGDYWTNIPGFEQRANCMHCGATESMEHVLAECEASGQRLESKKSNWIEVSFGVILGCGLIKIQDQEGKHLTGDSRLLRILVSESAHLIWKLRCERVIQGREITESEIKQRWKATIESRLELDCLLMKGKYTKGRLDKKLVERTWHDILKEQDNLPEDWMGEAGVLVGIRSGMG